MKRKTLTERIEELERELAELKAAPRTEQHYHYHYPQTPLPIQRSPWTSPYPRPQWWYRNPNSGNAA